MLSVSMSTAEWTAVLLTENIRHRTHNVPTVKLFFGVSGPVDS